MKTQAPCSQVAKKELQAHFAQPVSDMFHTTSVGPATSMYLHETEPVLGF